MMRIGEHEARGTGGHRCPLPTVRDRGRPVLIVQSNPFNERAIATVIVAIATSNLALAQARGNLRIGRAQSGRPVHQL